MKTKFRWILAILALIGIDRAANAAPLTAYYDQAAWNAAVAGLTIGPYAGSATRTDTVATIGVGPTSVCPISGICVFGTANPSATGPGLFSNLNQDFTFHSICQPMCSGTTEFNIHLDDPILGFGGIDTSCVAGTHIRVNGFDVGGPTCTYTGFFGLVGPITDLQFLGSGFTDSPTFLHLQNIVVVTAPEPLTMSIFGAGLAGVVSLRRRRGARAAS